MVVIDKLGNSFQQSGGVPLLEREAEAMPPLLIMIGVHSWYQGTSHNLK